MRITRLTTTDLAKHLRAAGVRVREVKPADFDSFDAELVLDDRRSIQVSEWGGAGVVVNGGSEEWVFCEECETLDALVEQIRREAPELVSAPPA